MFHSPFFWLTAIIVYFVGIFPTHWFHLEKLKLTGKYDSDIMSHTVVVVFWPVSLIVLTCVIAWLLLVGGLNTVWVIVCWIFSPAAKVLHYMEEEAEFAAGNKIKNGQGTHPIPAETNEDKENLPIVKGE